MRLLPPPFTDDLGRRVPAALVTKEVLRFVEADFKRRRALPALRREYHRGGFPFGVLVGLAVALALVSREVWNPLPGVLSELGVLLVAVAGALFLTMIKPSFLGLHRPFRPEQTRQRFLAALLCPACAQDLKGIPARNDGVTVCSECGAAWRVGEPIAPRRDG